MNNEATFDFTDVEVLVTGGTSGIGRAIADAFVAAGASVTVTGTRPALADYESPVAGVDYRELQLLDPDTIDGVAASIPRLDVLVNNAGVNMPGGRDEWEPSGFADAVALNLVGPMRLTMGLAPALFASEMRGGASVVNMASMAAFRPQSFVPGYGAAKAGVVSLTGNLAKRWASEGVRVNAIAPGLIDTPMTEPIAEFPEVLAAELQRIPFDRMGTPAEIADATLFLSSSAASYLTGHTLAVDGGYLTN